MNSIYTERENILPHHAEWLDGCGASWPGGHKFKDINLNYESVVFNGTNSKGFTQSDNEDLNGVDYTHIPTGTEFCERVAEILGLEKPRFEQFGNSEQLDIEDVPALYHPDPIKGMAIEVSRLSEEDKAWLVGNVPDAEMALFEYVGYGYLGDYKHIGYQSRQWYEGNGYTITESPTEFLEYVAEQTGKEYKPMNNHQAVTNGTNDGLDDGPSFADIKKALSESGKDDWKVWNFPHKTYRILDSLDNVPLDTRFSLSEWIPPFGSEIQIIPKDKKPFYGWVHHIADQINCRHDGEVILLDDGHWMRIV